MAWTLGAIESGINAYECVGRLLLALACAAMVGWEREWRGQSAGLRTHIMVALGSAGFTLIALKLPERMITDGAPQTSGDPLRLIAAVIGGVGFLGAGAIIQSGAKVRGLTTAAGLWVIAAVGMSAGVGLYSLSLLITALAFITLSILRRIESQASRDDA